MRSRLISSFLWIPFAALGCSAPTALPADIAGEEEPIIGGKASTAAQNDVVMLGIGDRALCTGTLVAPNLVLTARHCVSDTDEGVSCASNGRPIEGGRIYADHDAQDITVYTGTKQSTLRARALGAEIVHDTAKNLCNHDLAFVVLDRDVTAAKIAPLRLTETTVAGERITSVGWGLTGKGKLPSSRMQRQNVPIVAVGASQESTPNELVVGEAICSGDSGGPALSSKGAVIGVVSRGGNGRYDAKHAAAGCVGRDTVNIYTRLAPFKKLVQTAFRAAEQTPKLEAR